MHIMHIVKPLLDHAMDMMDGEEQGPERMMDDAEDQQNALDSLQLASAATHMYIMYVATQGLTYFRYSRARGTLRMCIPSTI